ncbi:MAG: hypothetical protein HC895_07370 [Leptolyngbyaceae cyanobacterium SM1_3_5]|nr:hypothetical protein [Leptolyngbyaceae cyanobacterium SM1_3_5]
MGAAPAVKWNGLGYLLGVYLLLSIAWGLRIWDVLKRRDVRLPPQPNPLQT